MRGVLRNSAPCHEGSSRQNGFILSEAVIIVSRIIYGIVETAKANLLKLYEYLKYLLEEIPKHEDDTGSNFLKALLYVVDAALIITGGMPEEMLIEQIN